MFDYVHFEMSCPECGTKIDDFQTKDTACLMETVDPDVVDTFYSSCSKCKIWVEFSRGRSQLKPILREKSLTVEEVKGMGFEMDVFNSKTHGKTNG